MYKKAVSERGPSFFCGGTGEFGGFWDFRRLSESGFSGFLGFAGLKTKSGTLLHLVS
jgi:hypothetical protein